MDNFEFERAKIAFEVSGLGDKNKTIISFSKIVQNPAIEDLKVLKAAIEGITDGKVEDSHYTLVQTVEM